MKHSTVLYSLTEYLYINTNNTKVRGLANIARTVIDAPMFQSVYIHIVLMQITSYTFKTSVRGLAPRDAYFALTVFHRMSLLQMLGVFAPCMPLYNCFLLYSRLAECFLHDIITFKQRKYTKKNGNQLPCRRR